MHHAALSACVAGLIFTMSTNVRSVKIQLLFWTIAAFNSCNYRKILCCKYLAGHFSWCLAFFFLFAVLLPTNLSW